MILSHSFYYLLSALSLVAAQTPSNCGASVSLSSSVPGHGAFMYHDIIVENTGSCAITNVFAAITLPPYEEPFAYYNITSETGELLGLTYSMPVGKTEKGGTVVLRSMRVPMVAVGSVECEATCSGASPSAPLSSSSVLSSSPSSPTPPSASSPRTSIPSTTIKVEVQWGANPRWVALSLFDELDTSEVWLIDASNTRQLMKRESWDSKTAYTFSANANPLALPLSLELKSYGGDIIVLKQFITSFAYTVLDTNVAFPSTATIEPADYNLRLVAHPATTQNWVGLSPYGTQASEVVSISIKGTNTDFIPMTSDSAGFFTLSSDVALRLPLSALLSFSDGSSLTMDHVVVEL